LCAPRDRGLELPGKVGERRVAHEPLVERQQIGGRVDDLVTVDTGKRAADHVARRVTARFGRAQADRFECVPDPRDILDADPVKLDVLTVGHIGDVAAETLRDLPDRAELFAR
jgi:hypothetical protein